MFRVGCLEPENGACANGRQFPEGGTRRTLMARLLPRVARCGLAICLVALVVACSSPLGGNNAATDSDPTVDSSDDPAPQPVSDLAARAGVSTVILTWTDPDETDLDHIEITWTPDGSTSEEVSPGTETVEVTGLAGETEYTFSVVAVDAGDQVAEARTVTATPTSPQLTSPALSKPGDKYFGSVDVSLSVTEQSATLYYTLDGTEPTQSSFEYDGTPISMNLGVTQLRARAYAPGFAASPITEASYEVVDGFIVTTDSLTGPGSLDAALTAAVNGDEIRFDGDYTIAVDSGGVEQWSVDKRVTINGVAEDGTNLDVTIVGAAGSADKRVFTLSGTGELTLENLTIRDSARTGVGARGGAVKIGSGQRLIARNVVFQNNEGNNAGGAILVANGGAAIIEDSTFTENTTDWEGGAIYAAYNTELTVRNSTFDTNKATDHLTGTAFRGGAISISGSGATATVSDSVFIDNRSHKSGAAIAVLNGASMDIVRSEFIRNRSGLVDDVGLYGGGAVMIGQDSTLRVAGSLFLRNKAARSATTKGGDVGGAIRNEGALISYGNRFHGNRADFDGTAIYSGADATETTISSSSFVGNLATSNAATAAAVYVASGTTDIHYSSFADNDNLGANEDGAVSILANYSGNLRYSAFKNGTFNPVDFAIVNTAVAPGVANQNTIDADPQFVRDPSPGADGTYGRVGGGNLGTDDDYGDLRPGAGSPLLASGGNGSFLLSDDLDVDGDGNTSEDEPHDASGTAARVIESMEIGGWEVAE